MTLPEQYAHDYRDMAMSEEELRKMLEEFEEEIRKVAYEAGVKAERESILDYYKEIDDREAARTMAYRWGIMDEYYKRFI
jgi:arsenate reductase-like glutaredoxin family protein